MFLQVLPRWQHIVELQESFFLRFFIFQNYRYFFEMQETALMQTIQYTLLRLF
jgi:hypothetical protein